VKSLPERSLPRLEVRKVGSDPEALFVQRDGDIVPATKFVGSQRNLSSWIGTDGNTSTAELRPRPARDVWLHVRDIAEALAVVDQVVCRKDPDITLLAQPYFAVPCGGHIHVSFTLYDPLAAQAIAYGMVMSTEGDGLRGVPVTTPRPPTAQAALNQYRTAAIAGSAFGFNHLARKLRSVIGPLEEGLYPVTQRVRRAYGSGEDCLRAEFAPMLVKPGVLQWRLEYRYPSTWLAHPALALTYLGLAKLVVNNYHCWPVEPTPILSTLPAFLDVIVQARCTVVTADVQSLPKILRFVLTEIQPRLQLPRVQVDFDAWAKFLNEGRWK
jgi:hypothetical protein